MVTSNPNHHSRGIALVYVLGVLAVVSLLIGLSWRLIRNNDSLAALNRWDVQARFLAASGLDYALAKIGPPGPHQNLLYATDSLHYNLEDPDLSFDLSVQSFGLFARARAIGKTRLPGQGRAKEKNALLGLTIDLSKLPAIGLMNHEGNMVLAGNAEVTGPVLLWKGTVRKATDNAVRFTGDKGHLGPVWDSTATIRKLLNPNFTRAKEWIQKQEAMIASHSFAGDGDMDEGISKMYLSDSAILSDTLISHTQIMGGVFLRITSGTRLLNCKVIAKRILIESNAQVSESLIFTSGNLQIKDSTVLQSGQFIAHDSILVSINRALQKSPTFYVQGRMQNRGTKDSTYIGALCIRQAQGEGVFIAAVPDRPEYDSRERVVVGISSHLSGLIFTSGLAHIEGTLNGSLICYNLRFETDHTIWVGHLKDAHVVSFTANKGLVAPLLFSDWEPLAINQRTK